MGGYRWLLDVFIRRRGQFEAVNLACGKEISLLELIKILKSLFKQKKIQIKIKKKPFRKGDIRNSKANINLAKKLLSYTPKESFRNGIIKYFNNLSNEKN